MTCSHKKSPDMPLNAQNMYLYAKQKWKNTPHNICIKKKNVCSI